MPICQWQAGKRGRRKKDDIFIGVVDAIYACGYALVVKFADDTIKFIDFGDYIRQNTNPLISQFADVDKFKTFSIDDGVLTWGNDMDFNPEALRLGKIDGLAYLQLDLMSPAEREFNVPSEESFGRLHAEIDRRYREKEK